jgi:hypothetical protein
VRCRRLTASFCINEILLRASADSFLSFFHRPVKKKGGTAAGVPRSMGDAQSSAASANAGAKDQVCVKNSSLSLHSNLTSIFNYFLLHLPCF